MFDTFQASSFDVVPDCPMPLPDGLVSEALEKTSEDIKEAIEVIFFKDSKGILEDTRAKQADRLILNALVYACGQVTDSLEDISMFYIMPQSYRARFQEFSKIQNGTPTSKDLEDMML